MRLRLILIGLSVLLTAATDPKNPTCPLNPSFSSYPAMKFTFKMAGDDRVLMAEGAIDDNLLPRLQAALKKYQPIDEIWLRSPGGNAEVGNAAGLMINKLKTPTRIPAGWACFSACNFMFMGGGYRTVDPGGVFMVHMFTFTADGGVLADEASQGFEQANKTIREVESASAKLANQDSEFLVRAGVSPSLLRDIMYRQQVAGAKGSKDQSTRRCLTAAEMAKYRVTNNDL
jgi:hypothetical protein